MWPLKKRKAVTTMPRKKTAKRKKKNGKIKNKCAGCVWGEKIQEGRYRCFFPGCVKGRVWTRERKAAGKTAEADAQSAGEMPKGP